MIRKVDIATFGGLLLGGIAIFGAYLFEGGDVAALIMLPAMLTVFGGTLAATIIGTSIKNVLVMMKLIRLVIFAPQYDIKGVINQIVKFSTLSRRNGLLTLDNELSNVTDPFMRNILQSAVDGAEPHIIRELAETELQSMAERHEKGASLFKKMGGYSPTMGIIGTVMGLINTLAAAGDNPDKLIRSIAGAFIATLWGVFMANIVWLPIADKLYHLHEEESLYKEIIMNGILAIQDGEIPPVVRAKLVGKLPPGEREIE